jgi:hypothetical protein
MKRPILIAAMAVFLFGCAKSGWEILELTDQFNEKTGEKYVAYLTKGNFRGSESKKGDFTVILRIYNPNTLRIHVSSADLKSVNDVLYRTDLKSLYDAFYDYKRDDLEINGTRIEGEWDQDVGRLFYRNHDDKTSLWTLIKQEGILRVSAWNYDDGKYYLFDINCNGLNEMLKQVFLEGPASVKYAIVAADRNQVKQDIQFTLKYSWTPEKESQLRNSAELENIVKAFFSTESYIDSIVRFGRYGLDYDYQKDKVMSDWANPLLEKIRLLFNDPTLEYSDFSVENYYERQQ